VWIIYTLFKDKPPGVVVLTAFVTVCTTAAAAAVAVFPNKRLSSIDNTKNNDDNNTIRTMKGNINLQKRIADTLRSLSTIDSL